MADHNPLPALALLSDPTRQAIVERLRTGPHAVGELADGLPVSRPAVSQHLKLMTDAGLLVVRAAGARRLYAISPEALAGLRDWLDAVWSDALRDFAQAAETERREGK